MNLRNYQGYPDLAGGKSVVMKRRTQRNFSGSRRPAAYFLQDTAPDGGRDKNNLVEGQQLLNSWGYTSYTDCLLGPANNNRESGASGERAIFAYRKLQEEGLMTARVSLGFYSGQDGKQSYDILKRDLDNFPFPDFPDRNWLDLRLIKLFCDGLYMTHTAWMKEDYADDPGRRGKSCFLGPEASDEEQEQELRKIIQLVHDRGYQVGIHAIGNRAVKAAVEAIIAAQQTNLQSRRHYRFTGMCWVTEGL